MNIKSKMSCLHKSEVLLLIHNCSVLSRHWSTADSAVHKTGLMPRLFNVTFVPFKNIKNNRPALRFALDHVFLSFTHICYEYRCHLIHASYFDLMFPKYIKYPLPWKSVCRLLRIILNTAEKITKCCCEVWCLNPSLIRPIWWDAVNSDIATES
jgi:hypothetical protein